MKLNGIIDSRDLIERLEELQQRDDLSADAQEELKALQEADAELQGFSDYRYGLTLVADYLFQEYAQELAEDCGMMPEDLHWPLNCIDWEHAARELRYDYTSVELFGQTYWTRSC